MFIDIITKLIIFCLSFFMSSTVTMSPVVSFNDTVSFPDIEASKAAVLSLDNDIFLFEKNSNESQPIASITKLMTAIVFLKNNPGWDETYTIKEADKVLGGRLNLFLGDEVYLKDIFYTSLIASDNGATLALVHSSGLSEEEFVKQMNIEAKKLFLFNTNFLDPIGLSDGNVSNAKDVAVLLKEALSYKEIKNALLKAEYSFSTLQGRKKSIESTDYLLFSDSKKLIPDGGKTGYTDLAGYCFVGKFISPDNKEIISVILNSTDKNSRFVESRELAESVWENYEIHR